jgi:arsenate reductase
MSVTIYHNPACGTSRNTLAMIRQSGEICSPIPRARS